jgi:DNA-binding transcriptional LysR family regulator
MIAFMEIRDLEIFLAVAKRLNFTRAGEDIHLSQPSVSVRIHQLEERLGVKLFEQLGKKIALTEAGRTLEPYACRAVAAIDDARHAVEEVKGLERGAIKIGTSTTPGMYVVPRVIAAFKRLHPKIEIRLDIKDTRQVEEDVVNNECDFGFVGGHLIGENIEVIAWHTDELLLVVPPDSLLVKKRSLTVKDLARERFIFRERGSATQAALETGLREAHVQVSAIIELSNPEAIKQAVQNGIGVAFISKFAVQAEIKANTLRALEVKGLKISRELKIVYRRDKHLSRAARAFIEVAQRSAMS